jgi:hypothetical protein
VVETADCIPGRESPYFVRAGGDRMSEIRRDRLEAAKVAAEALRAALPAPAPTRSRRMILALTDEEKARIVAYAKDAGEPPATAARKLIIAALTTLGR